MFTKKIIYMSSLLIVFEIKRKILAKTSFKLLLLRDYPYLKIDMGNFKLCLLFV